MQRREFLSTLAVPGVMAGLAPVVEAASKLAPFLPAPADPDAAVFAEARRHFLVPPGVAYCNTGTLGACPREVVDALISGTRRLESELADWPYESPEGEPLTGYQPLLDVRAAAGRFINATADEIALTQNATMGMNVLANGLDLSAGDEVRGGDHDLPRRGGEGEGAAGRAVGAEGARPRAERRGGVRLSAHMYVSPADVDTVLEVVSRLKG